jgi:outer membrane protein assembly factor BamB
MKSSIRVLLFAFIVGFFIAATSNDPHKASPSWSISFNSDILWQQITPLGNLVINTQDGLYGVNTESGQKSWEIAGLGNIPASSYQPLSGTFFAEIETSNAVVIINPYNGRIITDTHKSGFKSVIVKNLLYESGTLLIYGFKDGYQGYMSAFSVDSGQELWSSNEIFGEEKQGLGGLINSLQVAAEVEPGSGKSSFDLIEVNDKNFIIATGKGLFSIETNTGKVRWNSKLPAIKGAVSATTESRLIRSTENDRFYFAKSNYLMAYKVNDGSQIWKSVTKINGLVDQVVQCKEGLILLPVTDPNNTMFGTKLNLVNAGTGTKTWGNKDKGLKLPGSVITHQWVDGLLVLSMQSGEKSYLNILDPATGTFKFSEHLKIKGELDYTTLTPSGLLYFTRANQYGKGEVNIFDLKTGQPKFPKSITAKFDDTDEHRSLLRDFKGQLVYVYTDNDNALYEINLKDGMLRLLRDDLKLEGKESVKNIEVRDNGILLSSDQNLLMLDFNGSHIFHKYYPAPTEPGIVKALYAMESVTAALYSAQSHMIAASFDQIAENVDPNSGREQIRQISDAYDQHGRELNAYSRDAMSRAKASASRWSGSPASRSSSPAASSNASA